MSDSVRLTCGCKCTRYGVGGMIITLCEKCKAAQDERKELCNAVSKLKSAIWAEIEKFYKMIGLLK